MEALKAWVYVEGTDAGKAGIERCMAKMGSELVAVPYGGYLVLFFGLAMNRTVNATFYDCIGQVVAEVQKPAESPETWHASRGLHMLIWDKKNAFGVSVPPGNYTARLTVNRVEGGTPFTAECQFMIVADGQEMGR